MLCCYEDIVWSFCTVWSCYIVMEILFYSFKDMNRMAFVRNIIVMRCRSRILFKLPSPRFDGVCIWCLNEWRFFHDFELHGIFTCSLVPLRTIRSITGTQRSSYVTFIRALKTNHETIDSQIMHLLIYRFSLTFHCPYPLWYLRCKAYRNKVKMNLRNIGC